MYSSGGGAGSRLVIVNCSRLPISPASIAFLRAACPASKRRLNARKTLLALGPKALMHRCASDRFGASGFSHMTAYPALVAWIMRSTCVSDDVTTRTASTSGWCNASSALCATAAPVSEARDSAAVSTTSYTVTSVPPAARMAFACTLAIRPAPINAIPIMILLCSKLVEFQCNSGDCQSVIAWLVDQSSLKQINRSPHAFHPGENDILMLDR